MSKFADFEANKLVYLNLHSIRIFCNLQRKVNLQFEMPLLHFFPTSGHVFVVITLEFYRINYDLDDNISSF